MNAAPAIAPVLIGNPVPQVAIPASAGSDETFGQMLQSVHKAGEVATSPGASDDLAMVLPRQVTRQPSSGPPPAMAALLSNSSQGTKPARFQSAGNFANAAQDGVGPAVATAPGLGVAAIGAGAVPAAPLTPLPEAVPEVPVLRPQAVAISGAPEAGASAFASPAEAAGLSAADELSGILQRAGSACPARRCAGQGCSYPLDAQDQSPFACRVYVRRMGDYGSWLDIIAARDTCPHCCRSPDGHFVARRDTYRARGRCVQGRCVYISRGGSSTVGSIIT